MLTTLPKASSRLSCPLPFRFVTNPVGVRALLLSKIYDALTYSMCESTDYSYLPLPTNIFPLTYYPFSHSPVVFPLS